MADLEPGVTLSADTIAAMKRLSTSPHTAMTKPDYRLTPEQWESIERYAEDNAYDACFLELRARIEALEAGATCPHVRSSDEGTSYCALAEAAAPQPPLFTAEEVARIVAPTVKKSLTDPPGTLLDRVASAIFSAEGETEGTQAEARAAILEVAAWLRSQDDGLLAYGLDWATRLEREANR